MPSPSVSCVIPVFNGAPYMQQAFDSIYAQTYPVSEIIVVDDLSTDGSVAIAKANAPRVTLIQRQSKGGGAGASARNIGIAAAHGELIAFLDSDDLWLPNKIELQVKALEENPNVACCFTLMDSFVEPGSDAHVPEGIRGVRVGRAATSFLGRASAVAKIGGFDETVKTRSEVEWFARFEDQKLGSLVIHQLLARRRIHGTNVSRTMSAEAVDELFAIAARRRARARLELGD